MSISKSESAPESAERDYESERDFGFGQERTEQEQAEPERAWHEGEEEGAGDFRQERDLRDEGESEAEEGSRATTLSAAEPAATMDHDAEQDSAISQGGALSEDSMSGEAVQTQPQRSPMQPALVPDDPGPVLAPETSLDFRERWHGIQAEFIDDPRRAVEDADRLVADVARAFAASVEERRRGLTSGWEHDGHGETEELRLAMRQYRALVDHILQD